MRKNIKIIAINLYIFIKSVLIIKKLYFLYNLRVVK